MSQRFDTTERRPLGAAFIIAVGLAALGGVLIWQGKSIPDKGGYAGIGSGDTPVFVGIGLLLLALGHLVTALRNDPHAPVSHEREPTNWAPVFWISGGLLLQLLLLLPLGFSIASGLLFAFTAAGFGKRKLAMTVPIGIVLSLAIYGIFDQLLRLRLPAGMLENLIFGG